jgi:hypothetical protein
MAEKRYRVILTGSRDWENVEAIRTVLKALRDQDPKTVLVHGACPTGADAIGDSLWDGEWGLTVERHPGGPGIMLRRNREMIALGADLVVAFIRNGSPGSSYTANYAAKVGIEVRRFTSG